MTTPAVDVSRVENGTCKRTNFFSPGVPTVSNVTCLGTAWLSELRPASVSVPLVKGYRSCAPFYHHGHRVTFSGGRCAFHGAGYYPGTFVSGDIVGASAIPRSKLVSSNTRNAALVKTYSKIKAQDINLSITAAEIRKAMETVNGRLYLIARQVVNFKRLHKKAFLKAVATQRYNLPRELWCEIPRIWLELQYGWKPLMNDIVGAINAVARLSEEKPPLVYAKASHKDTFLEQLPLNTGGWAIGGSNPSMSITWEERANCYLFFKIATSKMVDAGVLGLTEPASVVWELLPYSFVVDWALPVGQWLNSLTAAYGLDFVGGGMSKKVRSREVHINPPKAAGGYVLDAWSSPRVSSQMEFFERECFASAPVPGLYVKNPFSIGHTLNGLALLASALTVDPHWSLR